MCMKRHEARRLLWYTHGRSVKFHLRGRESHFNWEINLARLMYVSKCQGTYNAVTDNAWEEVWYNNRYLCFPPYEPQSFTYDRCPQQPFLCANVLQYVDYIIHTNASSVSDCCCQDYLPHYMLGNHAHIQDIPICVKYDDLALPSQVNFNSEDKIQQPYKMSGPWRIN